MTDTDSIVTRLPNDVGGTSHDPIRIEDHELLPWEKRCHALADVLDYRKIISTEEKRRGVEALGGAMVGKLTYYERWVVAFTGLLYQKGILTPMQVARKMREVEARYSSGQYLAP